MRLMVSILAVALLASAGVGANGCARGTGPDGGSSRVRRASLRLAPDAYPSVDGSISTLTLHRAMVCEVLGLEHRWVPTPVSETNPLRVNEQGDPAAVRVLRDRVACSGTSEAYANFIAGEAEII